MLAMVAIFASGIACQADLGGPTPAAPVTQPTAQGPTDLASAWDSALEQARQGDGQFSLTVSESELTSFLSAQLASDPSSILEDPQVTLRDGLIQLDGVAEQRFVRAGLQLTIEPEIKDDGGLTFHVLDADFGSVPLPDSVKNSISSLVSEALAGSLGSYATGVRIQSVTIEDGEMTLRGQLR